MPEVCLARFPVLVFPARKGSERRENGKTGRKVGKLENRRRAGDGGSCDPRALNPPRSNVSGSFSFCIARFHSQGSGNMSKDIS